MSSSSSRFFTGRRPCRSLFVLLLLTLQLLLLLASSSCAAFIHCSSAGVVGPLLLFDKPVSVGGSGNNAALPPRTNTNNTRRRRRRFLPSWIFASPNQENIQTEEESSTRESQEELEEKDDELNKQLNQNAAYISGLLDNLTHVLDAWILNGSQLERTRAHNILRQIERTSVNVEWTQQAHRMMKRAGMPLPSSQQVQFGGQHQTDNDASQRRSQVQERQAWEEEQLHKQSSQEGRSALINRFANNRNRKPDVFLSSVDARLSPPAEKVAKDKAALEDSLRAGGISSSSNSDSSSSSTTASSQSPPNLVDEAAYLKSSELVASAGPNLFEDGETLGIGGLDDVLAQVKRRIWVPLAAPPRLLKELGIAPVRGLLLYGMPGCGKTLLARTLGRMLSPLRPVTVVSGPELMDKFVGSSEKNLRDVFDNPPDIYDTFRIGQPDGGESLARAALHVIILDEFDAMARTRGGRDGKGDQGDAGVARDSVVNQLLAKMDGVDSLVVPTLVIGLTNKRSLIESALLRPGRFEVQIEVPPPRTTEQRVSIFKVHTKQMFEAGRLLVRDAPPGTAAEEWIRQQHGTSGESEGLLTYQELLHVLATECDGMSGASLAGVARAAASHALERAVENFSVRVAQGQHPGFDCLVTRDDFEAAVEDVSAGSGDSDWEGADDDSSSKSSSSMENPAKDSDDTDKATEIDSSSSSF